MERWLFPWGTVAVHHDLHIQRRCRAFSRARPARKEVIMGALRDRMEQDLILRGLTENTRRAYLDAVKGLARYCRRPPD